jgi:hypothetical protein
VTLVFALSYNVGDSHVFFLSSHLFLVFWPRAAQGSARCWREPTRLPQVTHAAALGLLISRAFASTATTRARSQSRRSTVQHLRDLTEGVNDRREILVVDLNWQVQNGLNYYLKNMTTDVAAAPARGSSPRPARSGQRKIGRSVSPRSCRGRAADDCQTRV